VERFPRKSNGELIGNLGNLVNRTLTFICRYYNGAIPSGVSNQAFWNEISTREQKISDLLEHAELREAFRSIFEIADIANKRFQSDEPWRARTEDPEKATSLMYDLAYLLKD